MNYHHPEADSRSGNLTGLMKAILFWLQLNPWSVFVENRDSSVVNLSGTSNLVTPVWLNSKVTI